MSSITRLLSLVFAAGLSIGDSKSLTPSAKGVSLRTGNSDLPSRRRAHASRQAF
jgi:hypothetical protein